MKEKIFPFVFVGLVLFFSVVSAQEYSVSVRVSPKEITTAPCGIANFDITVENTGDTEDTYSIFIDVLPEDWYSISQDIVTLGPGNTETVYLFVTAPCYAKAETYDVTVTASGESEGTDTFILEVVPDHIIELNVSEEITTCLNEETTFDLTIKNMGEFSEDVTFYVSGDASDFVFLDEESITIEVGEEINVAVIIDPTDVEIGDYTLEIEAKSDTSYASSTGTSLIEIVECYDVDVFYQEQIEACVNVPTMFTLKMENVGLKSDTYVVRIEDLDYTEEITLEAEEAQSLEIEYTNDEEGIYDVDVVVESEFTMEEVTIEFNVLRCYGVDLTTEEYEFGIEPGKGKLLTVTISNTGTKGDTFNIISDVNWVSIKPSSVTLGSEESKDVFVYYSPEFGASGTYETTLTARSDYSEDSESVTITVGEVSEIPEETTIETTIEGEEEPVETTIEEEIEETVETTVEEVEETTIEEEEATTITIELPTGEFPEILTQLWENRVIRSLLIAIIVVLIILIVIYLVVMR